MSISKSNVKCLGLVLTDAKGEKETQETWAWRTICHKTPRTKWWISCPWLKRSKQGPVTMATMLVYFSKSGLAAYFLPASLPLPSDVTLPLQETSCDIYTPTNKLAAWWAGSLGRHLSQSTNGRVVLLHNRVLILLGIIVWDWCTVVINAIKSGVGSKQQVRPYRVRKVKQATVGRNYFLASAVCACDPGANFQPGKTSDSKTIITLQRILLQLEIASFYQRKCESRKATGSIRSTFPI